MQKGFTLIELIFAIVIIGVLAAVAVPQFSGMKQSAEVSNVANVVNQLKNTGKASYMNLTELSGQSQSDINMTAIIDISDAGDRWSIDNTEGSNDDMIRYASNSGDVNVSIEYQNDGTVEFDITDSSGNNQEIADKLTAQTGIDFNTSSPSATLSLD